MIAAKEAYTKTKYQAQINEIIKKCEHAINNSITEGKYFAHMMIRIGTSKEVIDAVKQTLIDAGYMISMTNYTEMEIGGQNHYYEQLTISWGR